MNFRSTSRWLQCGAVVWLVAVLAVTLMAQMPSQAVVNSRMDSAVGTLQYRVGRLEDLRLESRIATLEQTAQQTRDDLHDLKNAVYAVMVGMVIQLVTSIRRKVTT